VLNCPLPQVESQANGWTRSGNAVKVWLSDGRTFTQEDRELQFIGRDFVLIDRVKYRFAPPPLSTGLNVPREERRR
jgi:hypothetical protein